VPELPEVELTRRGLRPLVERRVEAVEVRRDRMIRRQPRPSDFESRLVGNRLHSIDRQGKFLLARLHQGLTWVTHLGMSGRLELVTPGQVEVAHTNVVVRFEGAHELRMVDPRTFGFMAVLTAEEFFDQGLDRLGPDALLDLPSSRSLTERLAGRTAPIKALLLDQRFIAGIGNIYADEILHRARVRPYRKGGRLSPAEVSRLRSAVRPVLNGGLTHGGTSLDDLAYLLPDGSPGEFGNRLRVYGREGESCRRCGGTIRRRTIAQRSAFYCPGCQG